MILYKPGLDIARDDADLLVNTVNTVGVMGAGVAKSVRDRFPEVMGPYKAACDDGRLQPGGIQVLALRDGRTLVNMATKLNWRDPSRNEWAGAGLVYLNRFLCEKRPDILSVLLPPPGCGHGGLNWDRVHRMALTYLRPALDRGVEIRLTASEPLAVLDPIHYAGVGSRETPEDVLAVMADVAEILAGEGWRLRTGEAVGADTAFRTGAEAARGLREIFTAKNRPDIAGSIHDIRDTHLRMLRSIHPAPQKLSPFALKLMARNGSQVFGLDFATPSDAVICWTVGGKGGGGTGQAIRLAQSVGIPVIDLGDPELAGASAPDVARRAIDAVRRHRAAIGIPMPDPQAASLLPDLT
jgi:O-acetyl-ADP-ribose deacetylase (regulator of RNase III)